MAPARLLTLVLLLTLIPTLAEGSPHFALRPTPPGAVLLAPGVAFSEHNLAVNGRAMQVRVVACEDAASFRVVPAVAPGGLRRPETLRGIAQGAGAIAAINGSFFGPSGFPIGTIVIDGQVASLDTRSRSAFGLLADGTAQIAPLAAKAFVTFDDYFEPIWLWGYNQPLKQTAVVLYNRWLGSDQIAIGGGQRGIRLHDGKVLAAPPGSGALALGGAPPTVEPRKDEAPHGVRRVVLSNKDLPSRQRDRPEVPAGPLVLGFAQSRDAGLARAREGMQLYEGVVLPPVWKNATHLLTAGPTVLRDGRVVPQGSNPEGFAADVLGSAQRSLVGIGWNREVLLIQIAGTTTPSEAAELCRAVGCKSAMNLDGGGSSGLWVREPSGSARGFNADGRRLGSALVLVADDHRRGRTVPYFDGAIFERWKAMQ
ncbi:MAG TPA: phosphodiester glycosidase family protein [bacterium]|nr:phosphodiester glycosidase family protein [bacterium]